MSEQTHFDCIIIGAGAAGLMCGPHAAQWGKSVLIIEHNKQVGRKILVSGGGKCNFTNLNPQFKDFESQNPHFAKSALSRYKSQDFIDLVEEYGIQYYEKKLGQLFCKNSAKEIVEMLLKLNHKANVEIRTNTRIQEISKDNDKFFLKTTSNVLTCDDLVIATGGLSFTALGATDFGHAVAEQFGHEITKLDPALVGFVCKGFGELAGISMPVEISTENRSYKDDFLFTHRGISGPSVLKISLFWQKHCPVEVNFLPQAQILELLESSQKNDLTKALSLHLPKRFVEIWLERIFGASIPDIKNLSSKDKKRLEVEFQQFCFIPEITEGYRRAEVTRGGVNTDQVSSKTLESKLCPGLYFIGEVLDVTGLLGGYNFQWAWSSAFAAGNVISEK